MKLPIFSLNRSPSAGEPERPQPPVTADTPIESMADLRLRILNRLSLAAALLGVVVLLADLPLLLSGNQWLTISVTAVVVAGLLVSAFNRGLPYPLRSGLLLLGLLAAGVAVLVGDGLHGSGRVFMLTLPFVAAIFSDRRGRVAWVLTAIGVMVLTGAGMITGVIPAPEMRAGMGNASLNSWIVATANFSLLAITSAASLGLLLGGLEKSLQRQRVLAAELDAERSQLRLRVESRTLDLERRLVQLRTVSEITGAISRVMDSDTLLPEVCELVRERFNLYYVGVFLIEAGRSGDEADRYAVLRAGTGEAGREMMAAGHRLAVGGDSMIGWACARKQARIALDVGADATRFNNPHLPRTRSELALPIIVRADEQARDPNRPEQDEAGETQVIGALTIQSTQEAAFDEDDITTLRGIADNLANAIENARLFTALHANLDEVRSLHRQYLQGAWTQAAGAGELRYTFLSRQSRYAGPEKRLAGQGATLEVPIRLRDQVIGSLTLEAEPGDEGRRWNVDDMLLVEAVASQAALALENARLLEETQRAAEIERRAAGISSKLWSTNDIESILGITLRELGASLEASEGWIELWPGGTAREASHASE